jgi:hypothetical protein
VKRFFFENLNISENNISNVELATVLLESLITCAGVFTACIQNLYFKIFATLFYMDTHGTSDSTLYCNTWAISA